MPTHQGTTQTDILVGGGGDSVTLDSSFEFTATYSTSANFEYKKNNAAGADDEDSSYEIKLLDATGATIATFAAEYTCEPVTGTATNVTSTRTNSFTPAPSGSRPYFPNSYETFVSRAWEITGTKAGSTFAGFESNWKFESTVIVGGSVSQTVNTQTNDELKVTLSYSDGSSTILTVEAICKASATASAGVTLGSPTVSDFIRP